MAYPGNWDNGSYGGGYQYWPPYPRVRPEPKTGDIVYADLNFDGTVNTYSAAKWAQEKVINFYDQNDNKVIDTYHELGFDQAWGGNDVTVAQWLSLDVDRNGQIDNKELASMIFINDLNKDGIFDRKTEQKKFTFKSYNDIMSIIDQHNSAIDLIDDGYFDPPRRYPFPMSFPGGALPWMPTDYGMNDDGRSSVQEKPKKSQDPWSMPEDEIPNWF